jgi:hypothetical protein
MMASSTDTSTDSGLEDSAALTDGLVLAERPHEKTSPARRPLPGAFLFASMLAAVMAAGAATNALGAGPDCVAQDLSALDVIDERSEVIGTSTQQVLQAVREFVHARKLCLSGHKDEGIALYQSAINTALGFDPPGVSTMARVISEVAIEMPPLSR